MSVYCMFITHRMLITVGCPTHQHNKYGLTPIQMAANSGHHQTVMELQSQSTIPTRLILPTKINTCENNNIILFETAKQCYATDYAIDQYLDSGWCTNYYIGRKMCDVWYVIL